MTIAERLKKIREIEELKENTKINNSVVKTIDELLSLKEASSMQYPEKLVQDMNKSCEGMMAKVKRCKLVVTKETNCGYFFMFFL